MCSLSILVIPCALLTEPLALLFVKGKLALSLVNVVEAAVVAFAAE